MHISNRSSTSTRVVQTVFRGFLALALVGLAVGCDGGGNNGNNEDGNGDDLTVPAAPENLTTDADSAQIGLDWDGVDDADSYSVYRDTSPTDSISGSALDTDISSADYTDETAENGTTYYYRVTAVASSDGETAESDGSGEARGTPFASPTGLAGTSGDSQVELDWNAAAGADTYNVYRATSSFDDVSGRDPIATGVSAASYTDESAENGTKYYYRVTSVNPEAEESSASNEVERTPFSDPPDRP